MNRESDAVMEATRKARDEECEECGAALHWRSTWTPQDRFGVEVFCVKDRSHKGTRRPARRQIFGIDLKGDRR